MADITLIIGNKNHSSWSMRPWLALKAASIAFKEILIPLHQENTATEIARLSPSGTVPVLIVEGKPIWDSLAICEYAAEAFPEAKLWPDEPYARAHARAACAEMHAGFQSLRMQFFMDMKKREAGAPSPETRACIDRIEQIWAEARALARGGDFLYGRFSIADAYYAPVVSRFITYGVKVKDTSRHIMEAISSLPAYREWLKAAEKETWSW